LRTGAIFARQYIQLGMHHITSTTSASNQVEGSHVASSPNGIIGMPTTASHHFISSSLTSPDGMKAVSGTGAIKSPPSEFDPTYSAIVKSKFNAMYRATPIPNSILYASTSNSLQQSNNQAGGEKMGTPEGINILTSNVGNGLSSVAPDSSGNIQMQIPVKHINSFSPG
jgi:hypothetical protein